jgi:pimeloyl-ACP methyl ester carboxylesterase
MGTSKEDQNQGLTLIQPQFIDVDGLAIRYVRGGRDKAEALLLLSPWPESLYAFQPMWDTLAKNFALIAADLPGFGGSEARQDLLAPEQMGEFVVKIIAKLGLPKCHAVGPDIGTSALLFAASNHPDTFASIVIGSGGASYPLEVGSTLKAIIDAPSIEPFRQMESSSLVNGVLASLEHYQVPDLIREDYVRSYAGDRFVESTAFVRAYPEALATLQNKLPAITVPVQIITGRNDPFVPPSNGEYLVNRLPHAKLDVLECGHLVWEDDADNYARVLSDWVKQKYLQA